MPELPEVETVRRGLEPALKGRSLKAVTLRRKDLRIPFPPRFAERLTGRRIVRLDRRAKYLLLHLDNKEVLIIHLGMSGRLLLHKKKPTLLKHDHVIFELSSGEWLVFNDARRFGLMALVAEKDLPKHKLFAGLGAEPLSKTLDGKHLQQLLKGRSAPIKTAIMDQRRLVGVGNIYASEALFKAHIHPQKSAGSLTSKQCAALSQSIKEVLSDAIASGGSTLRDYVRSSGELGYFQHHFSVYDREEAPCVTCGSPIKRIVQLGRSTFFCPRCQKR